MIAALVEHLPALVSTLPLENPRIGTPTKPPGFDKIEDILGWVKWLCLALLIVSLMVAGARLGFGSRHGDGEEHAGRIGRVLIGVILLSAAGSLVGFLAN
jgi:hypothetical protein